MMVAYLRERFEADPDREGHSPLALASFGCRSLSLTRSYIGR